MVTLSYTVSLDLRSVLSRIDEVRASVLVLPLPPRSEIKLQWETTAIRIWATLGLAGHTVPKHEIAAILAHPTKISTRLPLIFFHKESYQWIHSEWRANPNPVTLPTLETLFFLLYHRTERSKMLFRSIEISLRKLLDYLGAQEEHPLIQSSIAHAQLLALPELADDHGMFARLVSYLFLAKYGYDLRGFVAPERAWYDDKKTYDRLVGALPQTANLTLWISFMNESFLTTLTRLYGDITQNRFHIAFPQSFWAISDRQKELLKMLDSPDAVTSNKKVAQHFRVSSITASRDLARLVTLGLLYPHGKGRSIYYTKI